MEEEEDILLMGLACFPEGTLVGVATIIATLIGVWEEVCLPTSQAQGLLPLCSALPAGIPTSNTLRNHIIYKASRTHLHLTPTHLCPIQHN